MRRITTHECGCVNTKLLLEAADEPGEKDGANHAYKITYQPDGKPWWSDNVAFQKGPIKDAGINGLTNEVLLAIIIDRLQGFQKGQFACRDNAVALTKCEEALMWLQKRTRERLARGVEGTYQK